VPLLVTVLLLMVGLVLLVVGYLQDALVLIYLSIGCTAAAGVVLIVFTRLTRRRAARLATGAALPTAGDPDGAAPGLTALSAVDTPPVGGVTVATAPEEVHSDVRPDQPGELHEGRDSDAGSETTFPVEQPGEP
jgi:hypothetical protein